MCDWIQGSPDIDIVIALMNIIEEIETYTDKEDVFLLIEKAKQYHKEWLEL